MDLTGGALERFKRPYLTFAILTYDSPSLAGIIIFCKSWITLGKKSVKNRPQIFPNYSFKICMECYQYLLKLIIEGNELKLRVSQVIVSNSSFFGLVLCITKKPILWRHQLERYKNEIWEFKSDKFFDFVCTVFLHSITVLGSKLLREKLLGVLIF